MIFETHTTEKINDISKRDVSVDYLRVISLFSIFLLHCSPPNTINALLQFCVPAMVFVSGVCFTRRILNKKEYYYYIKKRFFKIVRPASIFAVMFGVLVDFFCLLIHRDILFSPMDIFRGMLLYDGIGYVWIMRVFFLISLLTPLAQRINSITNEVLYICCCVVMFILYRALFLSVENNSILYHLLYYFIFETIPYFLVWMTGMRYKNMKWWGKISIIVLCVLVLTLELIRNNCDIYFIRLTKYPPSSAYLTYGLVITIFLYELLRMVVGKNVKLIRLTTITCYLSSKSNELYLAHIPVVYFLFMIETRYSLPYFLKLTIIICSTIICLNLYIRIANGLKAPNRI